MGSFFQHGDDVEDAYLHTRDGTTQTLIEARQFVEDLWTAYEPFADADFLNAARQEFRARFWEMYLTCAVLRCGVPIIPRARRTFRTAGPDVQLDVHGGWIEAVNATAGIGPDAVEEGELGTARSVPDDQIILRLLSAIQTKLAVRERYVTDGLIATDDPFIVAVNASGVPSARLELDVPRIVRALLPIGHEQIHLDASSFEVVGRSYTHRERIAKQSGSHVPTTLFQEPLSSGVSAVVYSAADPWNGPQTLGSDFVLVHNPMATSNRLPHGLFRLGREYWVDEDILRMKRWVGEAQMHEE